MKKYYDICLEMESRGPYLTDEIGKCQRHIRAFLGAGTSRIDRYLLESRTYAASLVRRDLQAEFSSEGAISGVLEWIESRKTGLRNRFPILVDEARGIVKQPTKERYGLMEDVIACLFRCDQKGVLLPWAVSKQAQDRRWAQPSPAELADADGSLSTFGTNSRNRFWQGYWRVRVERLWGAACVICGCRDRRLLRAAHIKRVAVSSTAERLDEHNGLILAAHIDLAFEHGLISFSDEGELLLSPTFMDFDRTAIGVPSRAKLPKVSEATRRYLAWHRQFHGF